MLGTQEFIRIVEISVGNFEIDSPSSSQDGTEETYVWPIHPQSIITYYIDPKTIFHPPFDNCLKTNSSIIIKNNPIFYFKLLEFKYRLDGLMASFPLPTAGVHVIFRITSLFTSRAFVMVIITHGETNTWL